MSETVDTPTITLVPDHHTRNGRLGGRPKGHTVHTQQRKATRALKHSTVAYFCRVLDDKTESELWMAFITGLIQKKDLATGELAFFENGQPEMITLKEAGIELTAISWAAFKRAVEYKRGLPIVTVESSNDKVEVIIQTTGASQEFFEKQAKLLGLSK